MMTTGKNYRWVEAKIPALSLGTEGGVSQWCNRLPEVVMILVAVLFLGGSSRGMWPRKSDAEGRCGIPLHQSRTAELKDLVEAFRG
jgi:hypothetical protein